MKQGYSELPQAFQYYKANTEYDITSFFTS